MATTSRRPIPRKRDGVFTYVIVPTTTPHAADLKRFITWALTKGQADGPPLLFSPLPKVVEKASLKTIALVHS